MCDPGKAFSRAFTPAGTGGMDAAIANQTAAITAASDRATDIAKKAMQAATAAQTPLADSEGARQAAEERMRKLLAGGSGAAATFGAAPVGFRMLAGQ